MRKHRIYTEWAEVKICGERPEECLNRFATASLAFWEIRYHSAKEISVTLRSKDLDQASALCLECCCMLQVLRKRGFKRLLLRIRKRLALGIGLLLAVALSFLLQRYVWSVEICGEDPHMNRSILRLLQEEGIGFGAVGKNLDTQEIKLQMLRRLPELSWMAVNRRGGKLTVFYLTSGQEQAVEDAQAVNLVSVRDAVVTDYSILEGMRLFSAGDTVRKGQLLVSGFEDYGLCLKAVQAEGEIYGETWHSGSMVRPKIRYQKQYTGQTWKEIVLILGRKRINLLGNSRISTARCDKITDEHCLALPNLEFPVRIQVISCREYTLSIVTEDADSARASLEQHWAEQLREQMVAGTILETEQIFLEQENCFVLHIHSVCREMIAAPVPMDGMNKGETYE